MWNQGQDVEQRRNINNTVTQELLPLFVNLEEVTNSCAQTLSLTNFIRRQYFWLKASESEPE